MNLADNGMSHDMMRLATPRVLRHRAYSQIICRDLLKAATLSQKRSGDAPHVGKTYDMNTFALPERQRAAGRWPEAEVQQATRGFFRDGVGVVAKCKHHRCIVQVPTAVNISCRILVPAFLTTNKEMVHEV